MPQAEEAGAGGFARENDDVLVVDEIGVVRDGGETAGEGSGGFELEHAGVVRPGKDDLRGGGGDAQAGLRDS